MARNRNEDDFWYWFLLKTLEANLKSPYLPQHSCANQVQDGVVGVCVPAAPSLMSSLAFLYVLKIPWGAVRTHGPAKFALALAFSRRFCLSCNAFLLQQPPLGVKSAGIASEQTVAANDPMAWNNDGNGIGSNGVGNGTYGIRHTYAPSYFAIGNDLSKGNVEQFAPYLLLKTCTGIQ